MRQAGSKRGRRTFTGEERAEWVSRFRSSGLTQPQFAQAHGLKLGTLQRWLYGRGLIPAVKRKLPRVGGEGDGAGPTGRTAGLLPRNRRLAPKAGFQEVAMPPRWSDDASAEWAAEVTWPSGISVRLGARAEAAWIEALLGAVRAAC